MGAEARHGGSLMECTKEHLPPCLDHEIDLLVPNALSYVCGQSIRSESKVVGNFRFRLFVWPTGTTNTQGKQVSAFVEADPLEGLDPVRWMFQGVKYQIAVVNWLNYTKSVVKSDTWTFSKEGGIDRGWHETVATQDLSMESGWLGPDNSLYIRAQCYVRQADSICVNSSDYNTKQETGYIGLKNHGATCYMNGLLQSLFHVGEFRRAVYSIDYDDNDGKEEHDGPVNKGGMGSQPIDEGDKAPPLIQALQNVFYKLQTSDQAVDCRELMKSFGWDTMDAFTQHDVQELNRILCDRLEEQMKGSPMDGSIKRLFEGEMENYIECIDVDYKSKRNETFYDIQLNIKGEGGQELRNIEESLREFTAEETLEGDNAYEAEGHGKQRAKKGIRFLTFPPVLNLQLKRFHFDLEKMDMVKLNTRFEFTKSLDLSAFAPDAGVYLLYAVVVHSGDVNSGHYYSHIRPDLDGGWVKFDDDTVTPCSEFAAVDDNFAGSDLAVWDYFGLSPRELRNKTAPLRARIHNAYMLVYIREDQWKQILTPPDPVATNFRMVERCDREVKAAEQRRKEKAESQTKIKIKLVFEKDLRGMTGFFDHCVAEIPYTQTFKMARDQNVRDLAIEVQSISEDVYANDRQNQPKPVSDLDVALFSLQYRVRSMQVRFSPLPTTDSLKTHIPNINTPHFDISDPQLVVLAVADQARDGVAGIHLRDHMCLSELNWKEKVILLLVKYFCPSTRKIVTLGCYYCYETDSLSSMLTSGWVAERLQPFLASKEVKALPQEALEAATSCVSQWECWEEMNDRDLQARTISSEIKAEQLWPGDIIIWQPAVPKTEKVTRENPETPLLADREGAKGKGEGAEAQELDGDGIPVYPIRTVMDLSAHLTNAAEVTVTLHDPKQPLCIDGIVSNGVWGPPRPPSAATPSPTAGSKKGDGAAPTSPAGAAGAPAKEERPEDVALSLSPAEFAQPQERELKMDLRWSLSAVTAAIARAFNLKQKSGEAQLWLFHSTPSSLVCESHLNEPLNTQSADLTLKDVKDLQRSRSDFNRNSSYLSEGGGRKPTQLRLHAVELSFGPSLKFGQITEKSQTAFCIRFYDDRVREVGSSTILVPFTGTVQDILDEAAKHLNPKWGISGPLTCLEISEGRILKQWRPDAEVRNNVCFEKKNLFSFCLRIEADPQAEKLPQGTVLMEMYHSDRQSQQAFAQPFLLPVSEGEKSGAIKQRCKDKLQVPDSEFKSWRLVRTSRSGKVHLKDDEAWDSDQLSGPGLCLEHVHPNPTSSLARQSRYNKPLMIKKQG